MITGTKTVASTAVPEPLVAAPTPCRLVILYALASNAETVTAGMDGAEVIALPTDGTGVPFFTRDARLLYIDVGANGEGVAYQIAK